MARPHKMKLTPGEPKKRAKRGSVKAAREADTRPTWQKRKETREANLKKAVEELLDKYEVTESERPAYRKIGLLCVMESTLSNDCIFRRRPRPAWLQRDLDEMQERQAQRKAEREAAKPVQSLADPKCSCCVAPPVVHRKLGLVFFDTEFDRASWHPDAQARYLEQLVDMLPDDDEGY